MEKMRSELEEKNLNLRVLIRFAAHRLNLLGHHVTPSRITTHATDIHKYFRNHHAP